MKSRTTTILAFAALMLAPAASAGPAGMVLVDAVHFAGSEEGQEKVTSFPLPATLIYPVKCTTGLTFSGSACPAEDCSGQGNVPWAECTAGGLYDAVIEGVRDDVDEYPGRVSDWY